MLDALGIGLLAPIFPDIIRRFNYDTATISQYYGIFISLYALMQFFASPILGVISDRFGRRPILLTSLVGAALDYLVMAFAPQLWIVFVGRMVSGLTGASMTVASAYMADISDDKNRSANFGLIGAAWGIGFILGPAMGGALGGMDWHYPFFAAAFLSFLNFIFGLFILPESLPANLRREIDLKRINPFASIKKILKPSPVLILIWAYLLIFMAGQVHPSTWTLYTQLKFHWTAIDVGLSLSFVGTSIALVQGGLTRIIIPKLGEERALQIGILISAFGYAAFSLATQGWMMYLIMAPFAIGGISGPALQSLIAKRTPSNEQGELQGTLVGLSSLTAIVGPLIFTGLFAHFTKENAPIYFPGASYFFASMICLLCVVLVWRIRRTS